VSRNAFFPSLGGWQLGRAFRAFVEALLPGERFRLLAYLLLPTLSRFSLLGGFAATMKGFVMVSNQTLLPSTKYWIAGVIFVVLSLASLLQYAQLRTLSRINLDLRRFARRVIANELERLGPIPGGSTDAGSKLESYLELEKQFSKGVGPGLVASVELIAGLIFVSLILLAITVVMPVAGAILAISGILLLGVLRHKVNEIKDPSPKDSRVAAKERAKLVSGLLRGVTDETDAARYETNEADEGQERKKFEEKRGELRMSALSHFASALIVTLCFLLFAVNGLRTHDPIHLIVFVVAVRIFAMNGRLLLKHWSEILRRKNILFAFAMILTGRDGFAKLAAPLGNRRERVRLREQPSVQEEET